MRQWTVKVCVWLTLQNTNLGKYSAFKRDSTCSTGSGNSITGMSSNFSEADSNDPWSKPKRPLKTGECNASTDRCTRKSVCVGGKGASVGWGSDAREYWETVRMMILPSLSHNSGCLTTFVGNEGDVTGRAWDGSEVNAIAAELRVSFTGKRSNDVRV